MLAIEYLVDHRPEGVRSVVLSSSLPACWLWGEEQHRQMRYLPADERAAIAEGERTGRYDSAAFRAAQDHYMTLFCSGPASPDDPECLRRPKRAGRESYLATQGDNEFSPTGIFSTWDYLDRIHEIEQPALVISGTDDLCTPRIAKSMADRIPNARWELMAGCRHMCFADDTNGYVTLLESWLAEND
jgi:proline iminopeptidase